jgi:hypothetical protein
MKIQDLKPRKNIRQDLPSQKLIEFYKNYCVDGCLLCQFCESKFCLRLFEIIIRKAEIICKFTCDKCGEESTFTQTRDELVYLLYRLRFKYPQDTNSYIYSQLRCFSMLEQYPHLLKTETSRNNYKSMKHKIEVALNDSKRQKAMMKYFSNPGGA